MPEKDKNEKTCDEVFYEYLSTFKDKVNDKYLTLLIEFIILFREFNDVRKNKDLPPDEKEDGTNRLKPDLLPDLCNGFYGEFLDSNNFFGIVKKEEREEIIEIIQHFCIWLYKNNYTKSKLSIVSSS